MAEADSISLVVQIGHTAGMVWKALADNGPLSLAKLVKMVGESRDTVMQAVGWLAREDKISLEDQGRSRIVSLRQ
jgi:hypothetical protein